MEKVRQEGRLMRGRIHLARRETPQAIRSGDAVGRVFEVPSPPTNTLASSNTGFADRVCDIDDSVAATRNVPKASCRVPTSRRESEPYEWSSVRRSRYAGFGEVPQAALLIPRS